MYPLRIYLKEKIMAIKNWLKASYATHGESTSKSKTKPTNTMDTPKAQIKATAAKNSDMAKTTRQGNSSGGGSASIADKAPMDSKVAKDKIAAGIMAGSKVKPNQGRGSY